MSFIVIFWTTWTIPCILLVLSGSIINLGRGDMQRSTGKRWIIFTWSHFLWEWQWHSMGPLAVMGSFAGYECRMDTPTHSLSLFLSLSLWPPPLSPSFSTTPCVLLFSPFLSHTVSPFCLFHICSHSSLFRCAPPTFSTLAPIPGGLKGVMGPV